MPSALLMADQDVSDGTVKNRIISWKDGTARDAKHHVNSDTLKRHHERPSSGDLL
jgi:hypothetical protein